MTNTLSNKKLAIKRYCQFLGQSIRNIVASVLLHPWRTDLGRASGKAIPEESQACISPLNYRPARELAAIQMTT